MVRRARPLLLTASVFQAHVVNEDEEDDDEMETAQVQELEEEGAIESQKRDAASSQDTAPRPDLTHQPEIVESPKASKATGAPATKSEDPTKAL